MISNQKMAGAAFYIVIITILSKVLGFLRDILLAAKYGATYQTDAYIMAQSISGVITGLVIGALATTFIPVLAEYLYGADFKKTNRFINIVYNVSLSLTFLICIAGIVFAPLLVNLFAPKFTGEIFSLTVMLTRIIFPVTVFAVVMNLNNSLLQSHQNFIIPALVGFPMNIVLILTMLFFTDNFGIVGLTIATVVGGFAQIVLQFPALKKIGYKYKWEFDLREEGLKRVGVLIIPILFGSGLNQINLLVDRMLASGLVEGSIAALNFSNRLNTFVLGIYIMAIASVCFPALSAYSSTDCMDKFKQLLRHGINMVNLIVVPATIGFIILRVPILQVLFERGAFDPKATTLTAVALQYFSLGMLAFGLRDLLGRAFYALQDTKTPIVNGTIAVGLNVILNIILVHYMGIGGLALATSLSGIVGTILLLISLYRKIGDYGIKNIVVTFMKVCFAGIMMGIIVYLTNQHWQPIFSQTLWLQKFLLLSIEIGIGIVVYGIIVFFVKIDEVTICRNMVLAKCRAWGLFFA